ncbi:hypothetical protein FYZ48_11040 [Gimesia chilikensis]|uniref:hypothetical protein n=1 Tax=Gimesia chilikensis TaxID=2605989 RepID=UPI0011EE13FD|nr:hypothetical protein [Gimesia chilikensis]KAA0139168.1 hypothetical protein FYZ48_11040 [Gimesia chilikensis]
MNDKEMLSAAFHEAGHAIVAHKLGIEIQDIEIHFSEERNRWEGSFRPADDCGNDFPSQNEDITMKRNGAKVAVAGMLVQSKHNAMTETNQDLRFSSNNKIADWYLFFQDTKRTDTDPGSIFVTYEFGDASSRTIEVDGSLFGKADRLSLLQYHAFENAESDTDFILEVIEEIDEFTTWKQIEKLASALCEVNEDGVRKLGKEDVLIIIADDGS